MKYKYVVLVPYETRENEQLTKWNLISAFWRRNDRTPNINFISSFVRSGDHSNFHLLVLSTSERLSNERMPEQHFGIPCRRLFVLVTFARHSFRRLFVLAPFSTPAKTPNRLCFDVIRLPLLYFLITI